MIFNESLAGILGFNNMMVYHSGKTYLAKDGMLLTLKTVETLFVYCDVLAHVVMGDVMAPLLRFVDVKHAAENGGMHKIRNPPLYVPLQKKHFVLSK